MSQTRELEDKVRALDHESFEHLVHDLVLAEVPDAKKLSPPDGGADSFVGARRPGGWVVQAKHYTTPITSSGWSACRKSLDVAIRRWAPARFTFVFARNLTEREARELVTLSQDYPGVDITWWDLASIIHRLDDLPALRLRHLGPIAGDMDSLLRHARLGGRADTGPELLARLADLAQAADRLDRSFALRVEAGATLDQTDAPELDWAPPPEVKLRVEGEESTLTVAAWRRQGVELPVPVFGFTDDQAGQRARARLRERHARGRVAILTEGVWARFSAPEAMGDIVHSFEARRQESIEIPPLEGRAAAISVGGDEAAISAEFTLRPVPTRDGGPGFSYAGRAAGGLVVVLDAPEGAPPSVTLALDTVPSAAHRRTAVELMLAYARGGELVLSILEAPRLVTRGSVNGEPDPAALQGLAEQRDLWAALCDIEEQAQLCFLLPWSLGGDDIRIALCIAELLRGGRVSGWQALSGPAPPGPLGLVERHQVPLRGVVLGIPIHGPMLAVETVLTARPVPSDRQNRFRIGRLYSMRIAPAPGPR